MLQGDEKLSRTQQVLQKKNTEIISQMQSVKELNINDKPDTFAFNFSYEIIGL